MSAPPEWVFFTDRDLGAHIFPDHLRAAGLRVERHVDHFAHDAHDKDWLPEVARQGWVILSSDQRMPFVPPSKHDVEALLDAWDAEDNQGDREEQRRSWLKLSAVQRLRWLEQAKRFAAVALGAARRASRGARR